jgi:hypothetical protein
VQCFKFGGLRLKLKELPHLETQGSFNLETFQRESLTAARKATIGPSQEVAPE